MAKFKAIAAAGLVAGSLCVVSVLSYRASAGAQPPGVQTIEKTPEKLKKPAVEDTGAGLRDSDFGNDPARYKNYLIATIGNSLFDRKQPGQAAPVNRMAILYQDGTAKLWSFDSKDPVCPPLRDKTPIREIAFLDNSFVTAADTSVRIWNAVTGELLKAIPDQNVRPLAFLGSQIAGGRLVTVNTDGNEVTTWDEKSLAAVDHFRPSELGSKHLIGAALSQDGTTLVTIADNRSVSLWDVATKQCFATLRPPSPVSASVFYDDACQLFKRPVLRIDDHFWENVAPLKPVAKSPVKK